MTDYIMLAKQLDSLCEGVTYTVSVLANASALLWQELDGLNWAGFYINDGGVLHLGPFQGKVACTLIPFGKGVCGTAAKLRKTIVVDDVHAFPGHIACDCASLSEIVIPIIKDGEVFGVLDIDSPHLSRFSADDKTGLEEFVDILIKHI